MSIAISISEHGDGENVNMLPGVGWPQGANLGLIYGQTLWGKSATREK